MIKFVIRAGDYLDDVVVHKFETIKSFEYSIDDNRVLHLHALDWQTGKVKQVWVYNADTWKEFTFFFEETNESSSNS